MNQKEYNELSECTEKKFPDGITLSLNKYASLDLNMTSITEKSDYIDTLKKFLIYQDHPIESTDPEDNVTLTQDQIELLHAALGMLSEAVEINQAVWSWIKLGNLADLDVANIGEEIGDEFWYISIFLRKLGLSAEDIMDTNIAKLKSRYGDKFSNHSAINRDVDTERAILEAPELV